MASDDHEPRPHDHAERIPFRPRDTWDILRSTVHEFFEDKAPRQAAALAYFALLAMGPLLVVCIAIAGLVFGADVVRAAIVGQFSALLGGAGGLAVDDIIRGSAVRGRAVLAVIVGTIVLLGGALGVFAQLKETLNTMWEVEPRPVEGWWRKVVSVLRRDLVSFAGLLGAAFLLTVSLVVSAAVGAMGGWLSARLAAGELLAQLVNGALSVLVLWGLFALMFRSVPDARVAWRDVAVGAFVTAFLFVVGEVAIGLYLGHSRFTSGYGAGGAVLLILVWLYYSGIILCLGAELTQVYANRYGARVRPSPGARSLQEDVLAEHAPPEREGTDAKARRRRERAT